MVLEMVILELVKRKCRHTMTFTIVYIMRRILSMLLTPLNSKMVSLQWLRIII
nr:MAG TPA: hypothetical protein [Caudoviricetes sp.]